MGSRNPRGEMPFLDHLEELRWRIIWSILAVVIATLVGFGLVVHFDVLELLVEPVRKASGDPNLSLMTLSPADPFFITLKLAIVVGLILAFPIVLYQVWAFLAPALEKDEKRAVIPALYMGLVLFLCGVLTAYFAMPMTLKFFATFSGQSLHIGYEAGKTLGFVTKMLLGFGILFELPVVIMILTALGLVTPTFLRQKRRHAIVVITALASIITPGDAVTLTIMLIIPLLGLYEMSIFLSARIYKRRQERLAEVLEPSDSPPEGSVERDEPAMSAEMDDDA